MKKEGDRRGKTGRRVQRIEVGGVSENKSSQLTYGVSKEEVDNFNEGAVK